MDRDNRNWVLKDEQDIMIKFDNNNNNVQDQNRHTFVHTHICYS